METQMRSQKSEFTEEVIRIIKEISRLVFNVNSDEELEDAFGISRENFEETTRKILAGLPDRLFTQANKKKLEELKAICAREIIFFQVQEKWNDAQYEKDLVNFMRIFIRDIEKQF